MRILNQDDDKSIDNILLCLTESEARELIKQSMKIVENAFGRDDARTLDANALLARLEQNSDTDPD